MIVHKTHSEEITKTGFSEDYKVLQNSFTIQELNLT